MGLSLSLRCWAAQQLVNTDHLQKDWVCRNRKESLANHDYSRTVCIVGLPTRQGKQEL